MLLLRMVVFIVIVIFAFAITVSYVYGISISDWYREQVKFFTSNEKSNEEKRRKIKKETSKR